MLKVGERYYFVAHAYFHYVGTVEEILGVRRVALKDAVQVHRCGRNWTDFFKNGFGKDTTYDVIGNIPDVGFISAIEWNHDVPNRR